MRLIGTLRDGCRQLQDIFPTRLWLAIFCCLTFFVLLLAGMALTTSAPHTTHLAVNHTAASHSESNISEPSLSASSHSASHKTNCHDRQPSSDWHSTSLLTMCCAWICSAHAVLPNMLTAAFQPVERIRTDSFNFARIQNPQLAHRRPIERPPRLLA